MCPGGIGGGIGGTKEETKEEQHKWVLPILNRCGEIVQEYVRVGMKKSKVSSIRDNARVVVGKFLKFKKKKIENFENGQLTTCH